MSQAAMKRVRAIARVVCAIALLCGVPAPGSALQAAAESACTEVQRCLDLLQDGIDFIAAGRWEAASVVLEEVAAGLEEQPSYEGDLARALVHLGVARLQIADADETRQLFAEAQVRDPTLQLDPAEFPGDVLEIWEEARELGVLVVESEPAGADVSVDGAMRGRTPVSVAGLKPGEYRVTLARAGYVDASRVLSVRGGTDRLFVPLLPMPGATAQEAGAVPSETVDGVSAAARRLGEALAEEPPADVLTTAQRLSADTSKRRGRSMWRTLVGALGIAAGVVVAGRQCNLNGAEKFGDGAQVETLGGVLQATGFKAAPYGRSKFVRWGGACRVRYTFDLEGRYGRVAGHVEDHEAMLRGSAEALVLAEDAWLRYVETMLRDSSQDAATLDEQLKNGLAESVGGVRTGLFFPRDRLAGGLALAGLGALLATIWSDGGVVVEEVAVSVTPTGGVLASRSFSW